MGCQMQEATAVKCWGRRGRGRFVVLPVFPGGRAATQDENEDQIQVQERQQKALGNSRSPYSDTAAVALRFATCRAVLISHGSAEFARDTEQTFSLNRALEL